MIRELAAHGKTVLVSSHILTELADFSTSVVIMERGRVVRGFGREQREERAYTLGHHTVIRKQMLATRTQRSVGGSRNPQLPSQGRW